MSPTYEQMRSRVCSIMIFLSCHEKPMTSFVRLSVWAALLIASVHGRAFTAYEEDIDLQMEVSHHTFAGAAAG